MNILITGGAGFIGSNTQVVTADKYQRSIDEMKEKGLFK